MPDYLVEKSLDPNRIPSYKATLAPLSEPEAYETLVREEGRVVEKRSLTEAEAREVRGRHHIRAVEPNYTARRPPKPTAVQSARNVSAEETRKLHNIDALHARGYRGRGARIAVIDTGIHPTLAQRLGARLVDRKSVISGEDWDDISASSHGSWCISVIAAAAPEAQIVSIKALSSQGGSGTYAGIIKAVEIARSLGCTHISMSLGGPASKIMDDAVNAADASGAVVAVAAGNEQAGVSAYRADSSSPARAAGALCVAAFASDSTVGIFSNWGTCLDLGAIGVKTRCADPDIIPGYWDGTSMATPYVAAIAALLHAPVSVIPNSHAEAKQALVAACRDTSEPAHKEGHGFADALAAIDKLIGSSEYYPALPRVRKSKFCVTPIASQESAVITVNGTERGVYLRKGE